MSDIKINLVIVVLGATIMSEQECSKQLRKPILNKRGRYAGKQARDKKGNLLWKYETVPDLAKYNRNDVEVEYLEEGKKKKETLTYYTRKSKSVKQSINMSSEAYRYMISDEMPYGYQAPKNFKPKKPIKSKIDKKTKKMVVGIPIEQQAWKAASTQQRLEWHLKTIASNFGGVVDSYTIFKD
jgi:hypothetical protein